MPALILLFCFFRTAAYTDQSVCVEIPAMEPLCCRLQSCECLCIAQNRHTSRRLSPNFNNSRVCLCACVYGACFCVTQWSKVMPVNPAP